jgi:hypothetical protein
MKIINRIYSDYLLPSRIYEYEKFIGESLDAGFQHLGVLEFFEKATAGVLDKKQKFIINRHDIDTDVGTAKMFFAIEQKYKIFTTYYFRLSTIDDEFVAHIHDYGAEVGYHYEELASYCKINHIKSVAEVRAHIPTIRTHFEKNLAALEQRFRFKIHSVASHGDFVNGKLDLQNTEILQDTETRERTGIQVEAYDPFIKDAAEIYVGDRPYPQFYFPISPFEAITIYDKIYMLTHPRHWGGNPIANLRADSSRLLESLLW